MRAPSRRRLHDPATTAVRPHSRTLILAFIFIALLTAPPLAADGTVTGRARFERIKGNPSFGYAELYESNLFLSPPSSPPLGPSFRLGAPPGQAPRGDGFYSLSVPAGRWSILVNQPLFFIRPKVITDVTVADGATTTINVELPIDYSTYVTDDGEWTSFDATWYQTFVATGTSITGVSWKLAGTNADRVEASVLASDGTTSPASWPLVSARARKDDSVATLADNWVRWRSAEVPTVPGRTYAIRLRGVAGGDRRFAVFSRTKDAESYAGGRAHAADGSPRSFDLNVTVFSDNDGTAVLLAKTTEGLGELRDGNFGGRWGQTFLASAGTSLAAVDVWAAGADGNWDLDFTFRVFEGGPGGAQVGPTKTTKAAFQAFGAGLHGVSYSRDEVPLAAGASYYVEFTNAPGFNPYVMESAEDAYAGGTAYQDRSSRPFDLSMTIVTYTGDGGTLGGRVTDAANGAPLAQATVTLLELGRSGETNADGRYELRDVTAGTYSVRATKPGYRASLATGIDVVAGEERTVDLALSREACTLEFESGGFEEGLGGWSRYGDARDRVVDTSGGGWFGGIEAVEGSRFHGNEINGCCLNGGLFQQFCSEPGHRYRVRAWSNVYWIGGDAGDAVNRLGVAPAGATDPRGTAVVWSAPHVQPARATEAWRLLEVEVEATGPRMTVFLDFAQSAASGDQWRINCFDGVEVTDLDAEATPAFRRGDCDRSGETDLSDAIFGLNWLFLSGERPGCIDGCDSNDDGVVDISDASHILSYLFLGGTAPPPPGTRECGPDATDDALDCAIGC